MSSVASTLLSFLATMLPVSATVSNEISFFRQCRNKLNMFNLFVSTLSKGRNFVRHCCRSNTRHCRKNRSTCSVRQCCFDIVASVDGALEYACICLSTYLVVVAALFVICDDSRVRLHSIHWLFHARECWLLLVCT